MSIRRVVLACAMIALLVPTVATSLPDEFAQEGLVLQGDRPVVGAHDVRITLWDQANGGRALHDEVFVDVQFVEGYYAVAIGSVRQLDPAIFRGDVYLDFAIDGGEPLSPRVELRKVPAAFVADLALDAVGDLHPHSISVNGDVVIDANGHWVGPQDGLQGPAGPRGPAGPPGEGGAQGSPDTPAQVLAKIVQVDGHGSGLDADLLDGQEAAAFMRADRDTATTGSLRVDGALAVGGAADVAGQISVESVAVGGQKVISQDRRWVGSSRDLDADTLDGFDSGDFVRTGALANLDIRGGALRNVGAITPGGDPAHVTWEQTSGGDFQAGAVDGIDPVSVPGDLRLAVAGGGNQARVVGESGSVNINHNWRTVRLQNSYQDPVVIGSSATYNGGDALTVRVRNVRADSFDIRLQEFECQDGPHTTETVSWAVFERGHWDLGDGLELEAGRIRTNATKRTNPWDFHWATLRFQQAFPDTPVITSVLNTFNEGEATSTWHQNVRPDQSLITMMERGASNSGHAVEDIGYLAGRVGQGVHRGRRWVIGSTGRRVAHGWAQINYGVVFPHAPGVLADFQSQFGGDSCTVRISSANSSGVRVRVHETCDQDGPHTTEIMGYFAFESGTVFALGAGNGHDVHVARGQHVSRTADFGSRATFGSLTVDVALNAQGIGLVVEVSNDNFQHVSGQVSVTPRDGRNTYDETRRLPAARYVRVTTLLRTEDVAVTPSLHSYGLDATLGSTIDMGGANLINVGKINANLYDPVYRIDGELHATFLPEGPEALVELRGEGRLVNGVSRISLNKAPPDTPAWLFALAAADVHATVTPAGPAALYVESVSEKALVVRVFTGDPDVRFYYRLIGRRVDMLDRETTLYPGDPAEVTTAIDPLARRIWRRGEDR